MIRQAPFQSIYRPDFQVVEERRGRTRLFPHTEQLPVLWRALNLEFLGPLPSKIACVDKRADGFHKIVRRLAAEMFCSEINHSRQDGLRLQLLPDFDLVARISIAQQISEETRRGVCHRFRFYAGEQFQPEIFLSGKRVVFTDHVLQRFTKRAPHREDLTYLLLGFFGSPMISFPLGVGRALVFKYLNSILAFTYEENECEYVITTCLTINELHSLNFEIPTSVHNFHYDPKFVPPKERNWFTTKFMIDLHDRWSNKAPFGAPPEPIGQPWSRIAAWTKDIVKGQGHGPGSRMVFLDGIPGPSVMILRPGETERWYDEIAAYKECNPGYDWDEYFAELEANQPNKKNRRISNQNHRCRQNDEEEE